MSCSHNKQGNLVVSMALFGAIMFLGLFIFSVQSERAKVTQNKVKDVRSTMTVSGGLETMLLAYRSAEFFYIAEVQKCAAGVKPFLQSLKEGSGCGVPITVFTINSDPNGKDIYEYQGKGCVLNQNDSSCSNGYKDFLAMKFNNVDYIFSIVAIQPERGLVEFVMSMTESNGKKRQQGFAIRSTLPNSAHLEADGRVTQEVPDPLYRCPGVQWGNYLLYDPINKNCNRFAQLGGGTGLAFYEGSFFGFRPADGQIVDLIALTTSNSYLVDSSGMTNGVQNFVPYSKNCLVNVDDITLIGQQIYYVAGLGMNAHIGGLIRTQAAADECAPTYKRVRICELGCDDWAQAYSGIAALGWSDPLFPVAGEDPNREKLATFFLKTDSGDLLTAVVQNKSSLLPVSCPVTNKNSPYSCKVFKDANLQQVEFKRTYGFDRTDRSKPYFLF